MRLSGEKCIIRGVKSEKTICAAEHGDLQRGLVEVSCLRVRYGAHEAVKGVSFTLGESEILGIVGESGSGKSTIAKAIMGLQRPYSGTVEIAPDAGVQMIFQDAVGSLNPRMTVSDIIAEPLDVHGLCKTKEERRRDPQGQTMARFKFPFSAPD